ncbi:conserved protein of unknown function [Pseudomonas marincola]|uniref:Uncharacterized protein n=1 Tax=Pseudomonas marincola TaxID=437900 RepID=A0A653E5X4_9PSED|nr:conserved protein of unknown function [Pseudomonas marincola]
MVHSAIKMIAHNAMAARNFSIVNGAPGAVETIYCRVHYWHVTASNARGCKSCPNAI